MQTENDNCSSEAKERAKQLPVEQDNERRPDAPDQEDWKNAVLRKTRALLDLLGKK